MTDQNVELTEEQKFQAFLDAEKAQEDANDAPPAVETDAGKAESPSAAPIVSETPPNAEPFPGFNSLPAEIQDTILKASELKQQHAAMQGRLAPTQRELENTRRQLADFQREMQKLKAQNTPDPRAAVEKLRQIAPDEAEALSAVQQHLMTEQQRWAQQQNEMAAELAELRNERFTARELEKLSKAHPDWQSEVGTPAWEAWAATLPPQRQEQLLATKADDVAILLHDYKRDKALAELLIKESEAQAAPAAPRRPAVDPNLSTRMAIPQSASRTYRTPEEAEYDAFIRANPIQ